MFIRWAIRLAILVGAFSLHWAFGLFMCFSLYVYLTNARHRQAKTTGEWDGIQKGHDKRLEEAVRLVAMELKEADALERQLKVKQIVDAEFEENPVSDVLSKTDRNVADVEGNFVLRLKDKKKLLVDEAGTIVALYGPYDYRHVTPEVYDSNWRLEKYKSGKNKGEIKIFREIIEN